MFYPQEVIEQVIDASNIVDIISQYVKLTKKGSTYFGLCPFHNEKTPSFSVTDNGSRKMFYCFGCHAGGTVLTFLMKYENYSYTEALKVLADRAGITLPQPDYSKEDAARAKRREEIMKVYKDAAVYYYHLLKSERGQQAYRYLQNRQLTDDTILKFGLGYSDKYRDDLYQYIHELGYSDEVLKETGLFSIRETGVHDYFWNRVMFPIMDTRNRVIAFGGRVMGDGEPKYLNSPESKIFEKRKTLFGLNIARKHKGHELILCEGYMDVISLHQAGFSNAVASLGTALTADHAAVLKRYTNAVVLSYDSDGAGKNAAVRAIPILKNAGISVRVIDLKPYKDPDELIKAEGTELYRQRLKEARNGLLFEIDVLSESYDLSDPEGQTGFYNETARRLSFLEDEIERENYLRSVSNQFHLDYKLLKDRTIRYALNNKAGQSYEPRTTERGYTYTNEAGGSAGGNGYSGNDGSGASSYAGSGYAGNGYAGNGYAGRGGSSPSGYAGRGGSGKNGSAGLMSSQQIILTYLAEHPSFIRRLDGVLSENDFTEEPYQTIAALLFAQCRQGSVNPSGIIGAFEEEEYQEKAADIFKPAGTDGLTPMDEVGGQTTWAGANGDAYIDEEELRRMVNDSVILIKRHALEQRIREEQDITKMVQLKKEQEQLGAIDLFN